MTPTRLQALLAPYLQSSGAELSDATLLSFNTFLDLLLRWNASTNLTAIRDPEQIVQRHLGESLFLAQHLRPLLPQHGTVLDFGSGAGFPGVPLHLLYPTLRVTLAESQGKKASFLREANRALCLNCEVWGGRVQALASTRFFHAVTLRAVDNWQAAVAEAQKRLPTGGVLALLVASSTPERAGEGTLSLAQRLQVPNSSDRYLELLTSDVPRGTMP